MTTRKSLLCLPLLALLLLVCGRVPAQQGGGDTISSIKGTHIHPPPKAVHRPRTTAHPPRTAPHGSGTSSRPCDRASGGRQTCAPPEPERGQTGAFRGPTGRGLYNDAGVNSDPDRLPDDRHVVRA